MTVANMFPNVSNMLTAMGKYGPEFLMKIFIKGSPK